MRFAIRLYKALARAFPHEFKIVYGADVIQLGEDVVEEIAKENGSLGLFRMVADLAIRIPIEYLSEIRQDLKYACRTLAKSRGFTALGVVSLGLGIGLAAVSVSESLNLWLRDAPGVRDADGLAMVSGVSYPYIEHYRDQHDLFTGAAAFQTPVPYNVSVGNLGAKAERVFGQLVSPEYFSVLGVTPAAGRIFSPDLDRPGSAPLVFVSDRFWRERMNADPLAVGRTIRVNGQTATIVGVGPKDFLGAMPFIPADLFVPTTAPPSMAPELAGDVVHQREAKFFSALLRLAPGVTMESAEAGLDTITRRLDQETLDPARNAKGRRVTVLPGGKMMPIPRAVLPLMFGFLGLLNGLVVAIVCMNLANLQLARATTRRREVAIRLSVGASRFRLIRQLLTESVLVALAGGAAGILVAFWAASAIHKIKMPFAFPVQFDLAPDWRAILMISAISISAGIAFGLAPALASTKTDLASTLKEGLVGQTRGFRRFGLRNFLMVSQVAGSLSLLLIAGFVIIGFNKTNNIEIPFDPATMYLFSFDPVRDGYSADKAARLLDSLTERLKGAPGVREVSLAESAPFGPLDTSSTFIVPASAGESDQVVNGVARTTVGMHYFAALSARILNGREFDIRDQHMESSNGRAMPVIVNQTAARAFFGASEPVGRRLTGAMKSYEVIGVVQDLSAPMSGSGPGQPVVVPPVVYLPLTQAEFAHPAVSGIVVLIRSDRGVDAMQGVRKELAAIDPNVVVFNVRSLATQVADTLSYLRMAQWVYGGIGIFGVVLAAIGLAGVTAYEVARRRKEIGIRMALGAREGQVLRLVLRESGSLVAAGAAIGILFALVLARLSAAFNSLFGPAFIAGAREPRLLIGAPLLLAALAMFACYIPARRSAKIDPLGALREE